jgi:hypothetical protein
VGGKGGGWRQGGEMTQALYAHMNNKTIKIKKKLYFICITPIASPPHLKQFQEVSYRLFDFMTL